MAPDSDREVVNLFAANFDAIYFTNSCSISIQFLKSMILSVHFGALSLFSFVLSLNGCGRVMVSCGCGVVCVVGDVVVVEVL